jgi:hypothetical protein
MTQDLPTTPVTPAAGLDPAGCSHYWVIQPATGPVSQGMCQTCGLTREFKNYVEASTWGEDRAAGRPKRGAVPIPESEEDGFLQDGEAA